jgi:L-ectoine synthase
MIVRQLQDLIGTDRDVHAETFVSRRFLLARDGQSFSVHDTIIGAGTETYMWYKNHIEAVYCVGGEGELENAQTGEVFPIRDGTFYCLNEHDKHVVRATTDLRMICVFAPPLVGPETHDEEGIYPLLTDEPETATTA